MALRRLLPLVLLLSLAGCTAVIGGESGTPQVNGESGPGNMVAGGGTNATGGVGSMTARDPGRVTMRRLNQTEYDNTVRDLLGTSSQPARAFLGDTQANGFDNNGDLLSLSSVRVDQYRQAAEALAKEALLPPLRGTLLSSDPATGDACLTTFVTSLG